MPFSDYIATSFSEIAAAETELGHTRQWSFRKAPSQTSTVGIWVDLAMAPGNPPPNYYASSPMVAATLTQSGNGGLKHGDNVAPAGKFLKQLLLCNTSTAGNPCGYILCDYLLYYPFIDMSDTTEQTFDNTITLSRYTTGAGVQMIAVVVAPQVGGVTFQVSYTNQDGVAGRTSRTMLCNTAAANGNIINSNMATSGSGAGPFIGLQEDDTGVRSVQSITFNSADVGLVTLVLVKPLANIQTIENTAYAEVDYFKDKTSSVMIFDDAYLNLLARPSATLTTGVVMGMITTIWSQ